MSSFAFDRLIASNAHIAVAVSGGADSFALLCMMKDWATQNNCTLTALTVDHQLRPDSETEVQIVAQWCRKNGITHHILSWQGKKPQNDLQNKARIARRRLLCDFCAAQDIPVLLMGHQADDQAETIVMRLQRGTGLTGLRGIPEKSRDKASGVMLLRPLLSCRRTALRDYAIAHNLPFTDDPSNDDPRFERVRVRQVLSQLPQFANGVGKTARRIQEAEQSLRQMAHNHMKQHIQQHDNSLWLPRDNFLDLDAAIANQVLQSIIARWTAKTPRLDRVEALSVAMRKNDFAGKTLGDCWVQPKSLDDKKGYMFRPAPARK